MVRGRNLGQTSWDWMNHDNSKNERPVVGGPVTKRMDYARVRLDVPIKANKNRITIDTGFDP